MTPASAGFRGYVDAHPHQLDGSPWHEAYRRVAPDPGAWTSLVVKLNELDRMITAFLLPGASDEPPVSS